MPANEALAWGGALNSIRDYLLALVVCVIVPLFALTTVQALNSASEQRAAVEAGLVSTSQALATSVEHELLRSIAALRVLAASPRLADGDIPAFYAEARNARRQLPWSTVWLADVRGRQLMNLRLPLGTPLPDLADRGYFQEALGSGRVAVSGYLLGRVSGQPNVTVVVVQLQDGRPRYVIGAGLQLSVFNQILASVNQRLRTATASIVGRDFVVIARNRDAERWTGQRASESYIESLSGASAGLTRTHTLEGDAVYAAFRRVAEGGWSVGIGVLASEVEGPLRRALLIASAGALLGLVVAGAAAVLISRRITVPIKALAARAEGMARGEPGPMPEPSGMLEIAALTRALQLAADATQERDRLAEQARHITAELEAAEIRERQQIARDLHDDLAQTLSAVQIRLARLAGHGDAEVARLATDLNALVGRANQATRSLAQQLSPPVLYELGLVPALEWLAQQLGDDYGLEVELEDDGRPKPLSTEAASILYRCVRELLINVAKHARTRHASVRLACDEAGGLRVDVVDAGCGMDAAAVTAPAARGRIGLRGVAERLAHLGGRFEIGPGPGGGTRASMRLPLQPSAPLPGDAGQGGARSLAPLVAAGGPASA